MSRETIMFLSGARTLGACLLLAALSLLPAHAEEPEAIAAPVPFLSLSKAIERALAANPALQGFAFALKAQDARITQAGQRPATEVSLDLENALGSDTFSGLDAAEATFSLSQVIELGDKRQLRSAVARSGREVLSVERQAAQLDVLAEVTRRFIAVAAAQEQLTLNQAATALAKGTVDDVALRVRAAKSPEGELLRSRAAFSRAGIEEQRAMAQLGRVVVCCQIAALDERDEKVVCCSNPRLGEPFRRLGDQGLDIHRNNNHPRIYKPNPPMSWICPL